ncbi:hypothetical protein RUM4293_03565 [Ruegeria atlantica]|uniref:Uncharacterized protein n=1 Tax=Ruegeria atlantica TaxID=81569 RepID=A0A0P1E8A5_9RHOB|nr:hypothetical protein RUM4293_03565 [Ruegeria atlantica]
MLFSFRRAIGGQFAPQISHFRIEIDQADARDAGMLQDLSRCQPVTSAQNQNGLGRVSPHDRIGWTSASR